MCTSEWRFSNFREYVGLIRKNWIFRTPVMYSIAPMILAIRMV
jgi:hypothetical protein